MGQFTGLRCKVRLKEEFIPVIENLIKTRSWLNQGYAFLDTYALSSKANDIPFEELWYMPEEWHASEATKEWKNRIEDGVWIFQCSVVDYDYTIKRFLDDVLAAIATDSEHIEVYYEEWETSRLYKIKRGLVVQDGEEGIRYKEYVL